MNNRFFALVSAIAVSTSAASAAVLNEIRVDQTGTDNDEYFELFGTPGESLAGMHLIVIGDGTVASGVIESVTDLSAFSIGAGGFFVGAETTFTLGVANAMFGATGLNFENSDNVTHMLVSGFTGANGQDLDTNDDGILDLTPWASVSDSVSLINPAQVGGEFWYSPTAVGPDGAFHPGHVYRVGDGIGPWAIGPFDPVGGLDTPGFANPVPTPGALALLALAGLTSRRRR